MSVLSNVIDTCGMQKIRNEFTRLGDKCYLDNAGAVLYPQSLLHKINEDLLNNVYLNPHTDKETRDCIEQVRNIVLSHFNTNASNYSLIFTSGTTQSLKLVLESFQFHGSDEEDRGSFLYLIDSHTSVIGLRELANEKNADVINISHKEFLSSLKHPNKPKTCEIKNNNCNNNTLLAYPAQSNFNGYKYPIDCVEDIKKGCLNNFLKKKLCAVNCNWYVLLDAASFVSTSALDLSRTQPDFVCMSFYKIFGFPTGLGALLVKNSSANVLSQKTYFGGGTVDIVLSNDSFHVKRDILHERFEDGTLPFLSIIALKHCFDTFNSLLPKIVNNDIMATISCHTFHLAQDLYKQLINLRHENGRKAVVLYLDSDFSDINIQGGVLAFNLVRENGSYIGYAEFQHMAELFNISIRTGCFCNSGTCQRHLKVTNSEMKSMYKAGHKCGDEVDLINGKPTGAIRVSFGYYNTFADVDKLVLMITKCFVRQHYKQPIRQMIHYKKEQKTNGVTLIEKISNLINDTFFNPTVPDLQNILQSKIILTEMAIFPIKSCGAFKIKSGWMIGSKGFEYDREWMIIKDNGVCLTQKQSTLMCKIQPYIDFEKQCLTLYFKGKSSISIPLNPTTQTNYKETQVCQSKVCTDIVKGYDCGDEIADWISDCLEMSYLRLIRQSSDRTVKGAEQTMLSLSNQAQYLLINKATVRWLKNKIKDESFLDDIDSMIDRFRGNLVIESAEELVERQWERVVIGTQEFKVEGQCSRCQMVCIDQKTGEKTVEPLRTISSEFGGKLRFGIYLSYVGPANGCKDRILKINSEIIPSLKNEC